MRIVLASGNKNKLLELRSAAERFGVEIVSPQQISDELSLPKFPEVAETRMTYRDNALLKARACFEWCSLPSLGDDSGLEVEALQGRPGVLSARYAGPNSTDREKIAKLIDELRAAKSKNRRAKFVCHLSLVLGADSSEEMYSSGELSGEVLHQPRGSGGFGYDPIVYIDEFGATLAEVDFSVTCSRGFRAKAAENLFNALRDRGELG